MKSRESLIKLKRFQADEKRRQVNQIEQMVDEFRRMMAELDRQIEIEQEKAGISDVTHFAYPTFAKAARTRRDNLQTSIDDLQVQLERAQDELASAVEELKKVELIEERDQARAASEAEQADQDAMDDIAARRHAMGF